MLRRCSLANAASAWLIAAGSLVVSTTMAVAPDSAPASTPSQDPPPSPPSDRPGDRPLPPDAGGDDGSGRGRWSGMEGRPRGRGRGPGSEADFDRMIAVVEDISPEWASSLRTRLADDPEAARADFRRHGRRLFGLLMLKEKNPRLYAVRVAELALKKGMKETAIEYHRLLASDPTLAESIAGRLREMTAESVDLELRARAMELEALDQAVRELRERLLGEVETRQSRIDSVWKSLLENDPSLSEDDPFDGLPGGPDRPGDRARPAPEPSGNDRS